MTVIAQRTRGLAEVTVTVPRRQLAPTRPDFAKRSRYRTYGWDDEPLDAVLDVGAAELVGIKPAERARAAVILTGELKNLPRILSARTPPTPAAMSVVVNAL